MQQEADKHFPAGEAVVPQSGMILNRPAHLAVADPQKFVLNMLHIFSSARVQRMVALSRWQQSSVVNPVTLAQYCLNRYSEASQGF